MFSRPAVDEARQTWLLAWPIMISQLAQVATGFVDATMAGHASVADLAAVSLGSSIWIALMVSLVGVLYAGSPLVSQLLGAGRTQEIPALVRQSLWQGLFLSLLALALVYALLPQAHRLQLAPDVQYKATGFLATIALGLPGLAVLRVLTVYSNSVNYSKPPMVISLLSLLLNIGLNWLLIYGNWGFPALGAIGCGIATAICMTLSALALAIWLGCAKAFRDTHPFRAWSWPQWSAQMQLLQLGGPIGAVFLVEVSAFSLVALLIAPLGTVSVAAHQVALNFAALVFMVPSALGAALTVRVGQALGSGDAGRARAIGYNGIVLGLLFAALAALLILQLAPAIAALYTPDRAVQLLATSLLLLIGLFQFGDASQVIIAGVLRGYKLTREPMVVYVAAFWLLGMPLGYLLAFGVGGWPGLGVRGYWMALVAGLFCAAALLYRLFVRISRPAAGRSD